jgi:hypothetical protein
VNKFASSFHRRFINVIAIYAAVLVAGVFIYAFNQETQSAKATAPQFSRLNNIYSIRASNVFTDNLEPNDSRETARSLGSAPCPSGIPNNNLTLSKSGVLDEDWYRFTSDGSDYIVTISPNASNLLLFNSYIFSGTSTNAFEFFSNNASQSGYSKQFSTITGGTYFINIKPQGNPTEDQKYSLTLCNVTSGSSATSVVITPGEPGGAIDKLDESGGNDTPSTANTHSYIAIGQNIQGLNFYPPRNTKSLTGIRADGDVDWVFFYARNGTTYQITTKVTSGIDTQIMLFDFQEPFSILDQQPYSIQNMIQQNDDYQPQNRGSQITFTANRDGKYWVKIWNLDPSPKSLTGLTYDLSVVEAAAATATPSVTVTPVPLAEVGQPDKYEPNNDFASAKLIAAGAKLDGLSFVPYKPANYDVVDSDYFRMAVKTNLYYVCETLDLAPGVDTNLIVYDAQGRILGSNDDISNDERAKGNFASKFTWYANYEGFVYVRVNLVRPPKANEVTSYTYSLRCAISPPPNAAGSGPSAPPASSGPTAPPAASGPEKPQAPAPTPMPTPAIVAAEPVKPIQALIVRPISRSPALAPPRPIVPQRAVAIDVAVYNDNNRNSTSDAGEQVRGISVWVFDDRSGTPIIQAETDDSGNIRVNLTNEGPVRVNVPAFGYNQVINDVNAVIRVGLMSELSLPKNIP